MLIILSFEGHSPFFILFSIAPLSWFRIHSRFLGFVTFALVLLSGFTVDLIDTKIAIKKIRLWSYFGKIVLIAIVILDLWNFARGYHPIENISYLENPSIIKYLSNDKENRVFSLGIDEAWYNEFRQHGWTDMSQYKFLLSGLSPNLNILYNIPQITAYAGIALKKQQVVKQLINEGINAPTTDTKASIDPIAQNTLDLLGADFLISTYQISDPNLNFLSQVKKNTQGLYIYAIVSPKNHFYISHQPDRVSGINEMSNDLKDINFKEHFDAIVTDDTPDEKFVISKDDTIEVVVDSITRKKFYYTSSSSGYFLLLDYFYPGWEAKVDGIKVPIVNGNISSMAVFAPRGAHLIEFTFVPKSLYIGAVVSGISVILYSVFIILQVRRKQT